MKPEKHGINMGLKNMSDLREFETDRRTDGRTDGRTDRQTDRQRERQRDRKREGFIKDIIISFVL